MGSFTRGFGICKPLGKHHQTWRSSVILEGYLWAYSYIYLEIFRGTQLRPMWVGLEADNGWIEGIWPESDQFYQQMIDLLSKNMDLLGYMRYSRDTSKEWWILRLLGHIIWTIPGSYHILEVFLPTVICWTVWCFRISRLIKTEVWQCGSQWMQRRTLTMGRQR